MLMMIMTTTTTTTTEKRVVVPLSCDRWHTLCDTGCTIVPSIFNSKHNYIRTSYAPKNDGWNLIIVCRTRVALLIHAAYHPLYPLGRRAHISELANPRRRAQESLHKRLDRLQLLLASFVRRSHKRVTGEAEDRFNNTKSAISEPQNKPPSIDERPTSKPAMIRFRKAVMIPPPQQEDVPVELATLLEQQRFDEIYEVFQFHSHLEKWLGLLQSKSSVTTATILHDMIRADAPLHLIDLALVKLAELRRGECPTLAMDSETGQTALHIAVIHGADLAMIRRLTAHSTLAASSMDSFRRFPLHWACAGVTSTGSSGSSPARRRKQRGTQPARAAAVAADTIHFLLELFPEAMTVKDIGGKTPFDLATAQQQHHTALSSLLPLRNHQQQQARRVTMTRIQLELTTALWKLMPTYRAVNRKQQDKGTRRHARMRFVV